MSWNVRGKGLMVGIEFVKDQKTKERASALRTAVIERSFDNGLLIIPCGTNTVRMTPPLNISRDLVDEGLQIFEEVLTEAEREGLAVAGD
jgi:4-aminobutyrate aminotransferase